MTRSQTGIGAAVRATTRNYRSHRLVVGPQAEGAGGIKEAIVQKSDMQRLSKMRQHRSQSFLVEDTPGQVAEGVLNAKSVHRMSAELGVEMPISEAVYRLLYEGLSAQDVLRSLTDRHLRGE